MKKYTIELGIDELCLIQTALKMYTRIGLVQLDTLGSCNTFASNVSRLDIQEEVYKSLDVTRALFKLRRNESFGIFHPEVKDDCKISLNIHDTISHQLYLDSDKINHYVRAASPADICKLAKIPEPNFKFV